MRCVCVWLGATWEERGWVDERIGFGLFHSCGNRGVLDVYLCLGCGGVGGVRGVGGDLGMGLGPMSGEVRWCPTMYLFMVDIANPDLLVSLSDLALSRHHPLL